MPDHARDATLDPETIEMLIRLEATSQPGMLPRLVESFGTTGTALLERMRDSLAQPTPAQFARDAHSLKGAAGAIGALRLKRACAEAERATETGTRRTVLDRIAHEFHAARTALESLPGVRAPDVVSG